jgi:hypothetical protein
MAGYGANLRAYDRQRLPSPLSDCWTAGLYETTTAPRLVSPMNFRFLWGFLHPPRSGVLRKPGQLRTCATAGALSPLILRRGSW